MRNLLILISKYNAVFFFVILEVLSIYLIVNYNNKQKDIFLYSSNLVVGKINSKYSDFLQYLSLKERNKEIINENSQIIQNYFNTKYQEIPRYSSSDTVLNDFSIIPAFICNKSKSKRNNRYTLDIGSKAGVKKGMGVISSKGIVGVIRKVNEEFSSVIPLHNTISRTSVMVKNKGYFGILKWKPYDYRKTKLISIPKHANVMEGDSIITSGFSTIFPKGIFIGIIKKIDLNRGSNYFDITVNLVNDLSLEKNIYIIGNKKRELKLDVEE
jgi:rod shape-determining protein MreC